MSYTISSRNLQPQMIPRKSDGRNLNGIIKIELSEVAKNEIMNDVVSGGKSDLQARFPQIISNFELLQRKSRAIIDEYKCR